MPTSPPKTLSPAELAKLEHAFATDPSSGAWRDLAEAYLGMGRFMEAMVVCKKGVKAHPTSPEPRTLLARVYAEQGKDKKALEELAAALQAAPGDKDALRLQGGLQLKTGETDAGKASLIQAFQADPSDPQTLEALKQWNIDAPAVAAPAPVPQAAPAAAAQGGPPVLTPAAGPVAQPVAPGVWSQPPGQPAARPNVHAAPGGQPAAPAAHPQPAARPVPHNGAVGRGQAVARPRPRPSPKASRAWDEDDEPLSEEVEISRRGRARHQKSGAGSKAVFFALLFLAPMSVAGYYFWGQYQARIARETRKNLEAATEELKHDSYASYKSACELADKVLELDPHSAAAHGYLAYAWAIRWGEHGGGDDARRKAEEHLKLARTGQELSSYLYAAEALIKTYAGQGKAAMAELESRVQALEAQNKRSSLLSLTLGLIQMNAGDLDRAQQNLDKAQSLAPDDPRVYAALGTLYRRRGQETQAWRNFDFALRYEKDHPESLLGKALLMLETENVQYYEGAAAMIKRLLEVDPPPSPRQLATAHLARAFLVSRVYHEARYYKDDVQKKLHEATHVPMAKKDVEAEVEKEEENGFLLDRSNPELLSIKGRRLLLEGEVDKAVEQFRKAIEMDASRAQFYVELARALMERKGGEKEAAEALSTALKTMGESPKLTLMLGQAYARMGQRDKAIEQFEKALGDGKQKAPEARLALGIIYREKKSYDKAQELIKKAAQEFVGQDARVAAAFTELARVLEEKGEREEAGETYQRALKADGDYADAYYFFARYLAQDRSLESKARLAAREYLKRAPRGDYAREAERLAR